MSEDKIISIDEKALKEMHNRLQDFMKGLPGDQQDALKLVLARAAGSEASEEVIGGYLRVANETKAESLLPILARSIDGKSLMPGLNKLWTYVAWTHHHKK